MSSQGVCLISYSLQNAARRPWGFVPKIVLITTTLPKHTRRPAYSRYLIVIIVRKKECWRREGGEERTRQTLLSQASSGDAHSKLRNPSPGNQTPSQHQGLHLGSVVVFLFSFKNKYLWDKEAANV